MPGILTIPFQQAGYPEECLMQSITGTSLNSSGLSIVGTDILTANVYPRIIGSGYGGAVTSDDTIPTTSTVQLSIKQTTGASAPLLAQTGNLTRSTDSNGTYYTGLLNTDTTQMIAALGSARSITGIGEIIITDVSADPQRFQFPVTIYAPAYAGTEGAPTSATPGYYTETQSDARYAQIVPTNGSYRVVTNSNGTFFQLYNQSTGLWHTISITGAAGAESLAISPGTT